MTGASYLLQDINDYLKGGMLQLGAIALVVMTIILLLLFDVRWRLLPLVVIVFGVTWAFGLAGYLGIPLTLVTIAGLPVMIGIGIDYAIQMHARVEEEVVIDRSPHPIQETARGLCPALVVVTLDAVFAFTALRFAKVPMLRDFGLLLSVGIAVICLASIIIPLSVLGIREYRSPTKRRDFRHGRLGLLTRWLGSLPLWTAPVLAGASLLVFFGGILVEDQLELQSDPVEWVDQSSASIRDFRQVEAETGSSSELAFFVQTAPDEVFAQPTVDFISDYAYDLLDRFGGETPPGKISPELLTATSLVTTVDYAIEVPGSERVNPLASDVEIAYELAPDDIKASTVNLAAGAQNLIFRYGDRSLEERKATVNEIRDTVDPPDGIKAVPSGLAIVGVGLLENLQANRVLLTYLALLFVGIYLTIRLRSLTRALLSLVPVTIAVGLSALVAYAFGWKLSPMTAVGGPARRGRVHRVHVPDPAALPRGATPRPVAPPSRRRGRLAHRAGLHRVGPHRDHRRADHRPVASPAAAVLRPGRRDERRRRPALGPRRAAPAARVGRRARLGVEGGDARGAPPEDDPEPGRHERGTGRRRRDPPRGGVMAEPSTLA